MMFFDRFVQEQFANRDDLQTFYADQRPDAVGSTFNFFSVNGKSA